jgi:hypothetical protein
MIRPSLSRSAWPALLAFLTLPAAAAQAQVTLTPTTALQPKPYITTLEPGNLPVSNSDYLMRVHGSSFVNGSKVRLDGQDLTTSYASPTELRAIVLSVHRTTARTYQVTVFTPEPGGGVSDSRTLAILNPEPSITSLDPATIDRNFSNDNLEIEVRGTNFVDGAQVLVDGDPRVTRFFNRNVLRVSLLPVDRRTVGTRTVGVVQGAPGGGQSALLTLTVQQPSPSLLSLEPTRFAMQGTAQNMLLTGRGITPETRIWFGTRELGASFSTATSGIDTAVVRIPGVDLATARMVDVYMVNPAPGGGSSGTLPVEIYDPSPPNPVPTITSIDPASALRPAQTSLALRVTGTGFVPGSIMRLGSGEQTTSVLSDNELVGEVQSGYVNNGGAGLSITVQNPAPGGGTSNAVTLDLRDALSTVAFRSAELTHTEGSNNRSRPDALIRLDRQGDISLPLTVRYAVTGGTAVAGVDYNAPSGSLDFAAGQGRATLAIHVIQNSEPQVDRTVILDLQESAGYQLSGITQVVLTIIDDDPLARDVSIRALGPLAENALGDQPAAEVTVEWTTPPPGYDVPAQVDINYTVSGTATPDVDYVRLPGTLTVPFGQTTTILPVRVLADQEADPDETIVLALAPGAGYVQAVTGRQTSSVTVTIRDVPTVATPPVVAPLPFATTLLERDAPLDVPITVRRVTDNQLATQGTIRIPFRVSGTATPGEDYRIDGLPYIEIRDGDSDGRLRLTLLQDAEVEDTETILIEFGSGDGYVLDEALRRLRLEIVDDDVAAPIVTRMQPESALRGDGPLTLELQGSGFTAESVVRFGSEPLAIAQLEPDRLRATVPASLLESTGTRLVEVVNPVRQGSAVRRFEVLNPEPRLTGVDPASAAAGADDLELTLRGQRFLPDRGPGQEGSVVMWNGQPRPATFVRPTELRVRLDRADLASPRTANLAVSNPAPGGGTSTMTFTIDAAAQPNPAPILSAIEPATARRGGPITLTVRGTGFVPGSRILWAGTPVPTTFVSANELQARVPPQIANRTPDGDVAIGVENPTSGGGVSGTMTFRLLRPRGG